MREKFMKKIILPTILIALVATVFTGCAVYPDRGYGYGPRPYYGTYPHYGYYRGYGNRGYYYDEHEHRHHHDDD